MFPGGKFPLVASAHMSVKTASAGVPYIASIDGEPHHAIVSINAHGF